MPDGFGRCQTIAVEVYAATLRTCVDQPQNADSDGYRLLMPHGPSANPPCTVVPTAPTLADSVDQAVGPPDPRGLLDERAAGEVLGKPAGTLRDWRYRGIGPPYVKVGPKSVRYRRSTLEAWLDSNTVHPGAA